MTDQRYARHLGLFGARGQELIGSASVSVIGLGGLGSHVAQQLAYLGVRRFFLIDGDSVSTSNLNRLIGASEADLESPKVEIAERELRRIAPDVSVTTLPSHFAKDDAPDEVGASSLLFGCVDDDATRLQLVSYSAAARLPYLDLASDVTEDGEFGGRLVFAKNGERCLSCLGELDQHALARAQMSDGQRLADDRIYGVSRDALSDTGPSVVSVNGAVASLAVTEFMVWTTGLREPRGYITYRGDLPSVGVRQDPPRGYCYYCMGLWGAPSAPA